ncbi:putative permease [Desulfomonile tiedjei DSM 6799]|uniref:Putative permease n=2 Tax=Desulfomonile tiedjei TaxID=2358 RepID=I4C2Z6_DESTA|nr:AEC family transporter [Desulfomonile tiedjei]AFM23937.1 putative permease [Desulfomonile tiedjei DSM 6799]
MIDDAFLQVSDRLVYFIFFPALLFWKIGKPAPSLGLDANLVTVTTGAVIIVFVLSLVFVYAARVPDRDVGAFCQGCFRFNTYIGIAVILAVLGESAVRVFGVLVGILIPLINVMAVSTLIWFSGESYSWSERLRMLVISIISNPLIIACALGMAYSQLRMPFPVFIDNTLAFMSMLALPMALISIGGSLTLAKLGGHLRLALVATVFKFVVMPVTGYLLIKLFNVPGTAACIAMIYFALPTSPANYILSQQLHSNPDLAGSAIILSTILSIVSISVVLLLFC